MIKLQASRKESKSADEVRKDGNIPAVYYGPKQESTSIIMSHKEVEKAWSQAGESTIVELIDGDDSHDVLFHEVQYDPVLDEIIHVDFYAIERGKKLTVNVPLIFENEEEAEKATGGVLSKVMHEVEIESLPRDLPHDIAVDLSELETLEDKILAGDLKIPQGVELITPAEDVIASVSEFQEEPTEEETEEFDPDKIEVEEKGKEDSEDSNEKESEES